jgi:geranylgeranyl diphosphate synthase, type II
MNTSDALLQQINIALHKLPLTKQPARLYEPIQYVLSMGGKRLRPTLCLMACELFCDSYAKALNPALALEIFHNFTLLHDDIMDKAQTRRNLECVHVRWNENVAILSGDVMQILAYQVFGESPVGFLEKGLPIFTQTAIEVCEGQQFDMDFETQDPVSLDEYMRMIHLKTAVLIAASLKLGALAGGANDEDAERMYQFGIHIGLAFQLKDDLLDVYGDSTTFGKRIGGDIVCNKRTFLLINALERADAKDKAEIEAWISGSKKGSECEKIAAITSIYNRYNIPNLCIREMDNLHRKALDLLQLVSVSNERKESLTQYTNDLIDRTK